MKNQNVQNKPKKCGRWLFLHSRFSKIFRGRNPDPPYQGNTSIKPSKFYFDNIINSQRQKKKKKKEPENPPPLNHSIRNLSSGYTEIEKRKRALAQDLFFM